MTDDKPTWYELADPDELWWCNSHGRRATHIFHGIGWTSHCCDPKKGGILLPCMCVNLTGLCTIEES